jgi:hypothetical protein
VWLSAGKGVVADPKGGVNLWLDQSGRHNDFTQSNPKAYPSFVPNALAHHPVVELDGINGAMSCVLKQPITGSATMLVVWQALIPQRQTPQGGFNNRIVESLFDDTGSGNGQFDMVPSSDIGVVGLVTDEPILRCQSAKFPDGSKLIVLGLGSQVGRYGETSSGWNFTGQIAEVMVYSPALSDDAHQAVESYLMKKYDIR